LDVLLWGDCGIITADMEKVSVEQFLDEPGGDPPPSSPAKRPGINYANFIKCTHVFWGWLHRDVYGYPKNLLDFKRPITRSGPLSVF